MSGRKKPCLEFHGEYREGCHVCWNWRYAESHAKFRNGEGPPVIAKKTPVVNLPCIYRGPQTGEKIGCQTCNGNVQLTLFTCQIHGDCTLGKRSPGHGCCDEKCTERVAPS